jgi:hypothetical protein
MSALDSIVSVSISANSTTVSRQGFGTPLVLAYHTRFADRYRAYTSLAEMAADGFVTYDDAYRMAASAFAQDPTVEQVIVGRLPAAPAYSSQLTITTAVEGQIVKCKVIEPTTGTVSQISYTVLAAATTTTVATAVELLIEAVTGVDASSSSAVITVTPAAAGRRVHIYDLQNCTLEENTADAGYDTELTALQLENDDWYAITCDSASPANVADVAAFALANKKLYIYSSPSAAMLAGTPLSDVSSNDRAVALWAPNSHEFAECAWAAVGLSQDPGSITWAFKSLAGVTTKTLTTTQKNALEADDANHYQTVAGAAITRQGTVGTGEFIDIRHGMDALEARIKEDVFALMVNRGKIPYTTKGMDLIGTAIKAAMKAFEGDVDEPGLLVPGSSVVILPDIEDVSTANKAARTLTNVRFSADLAGAIHAVTIVGTLTL